MESELPPEFVKWLKTIKAKRARTVIDHILQKGQITTEELKEDYGYSHPPRALQDVKDHGIVLEKHNVKDKNGRTIAAYHFAPPYRIQESKQGGRRAFSKAFKKKLLAEYGTQCAICSGQYEARLLQIDHRVPYEVTGDIAPQATTNFMLLCGSCNRAKSWSCEHCDNWLNLKNPALCETCYWANPISHEHVALRRIRRLDIVWQEDEVEVYDKLRQFVQDAPESIRDYIKRLLANHLDDLVD